MNERIVELLGLSDEEASTFHKSGIKSFEEFGDAVRKGMLGGLLSERRRKAVLRKYWESEECQRYRRHNDLPGMPLIKIKNVHLASAAWQSEIIKSENMVDRIERRIEIKEYGKEGILCSLRFDIPLHYYDLDRRGADSLEELFEMAERFHWDDVELIPMFDAPSTVSKLTYLNEKKTIKYNGALEYALPYRTNMGDRMNECFKDILASQGCFDDAFIHRIVLF